MNQTSDKKWIKAKIIILIKMLFKKEIAMMDILTNAKYIEKYHYFSMLFQYNIFKTHNF